MSNGLGSEDSELLDRETLGIRVAGVIRRDILFGRLKPGVAIAQQQLCTRFGISRMPVRDAMRQLAHEGLLTLDGTGHSSVAKMGRADIRDSFEIEGMLHAMAVGRVTQSITTEQRAELGNRHDQMEGCSDVVEFSNLNWAFHRRLNHMAGSRRLIAALRTLSRLIPRDYALEMPEILERSNAEHAEIVEAITAKKVTTAEGLTRAHVRHAGEDLIRYLEAHGVELD